MAQPTAASRVPVPVIEKARGETVRRRPGLHAPQPHGPAEAPARRDRASRRARCRAPASRAASNATPAAPPAAWRRRRRDFCASCHSYAAVKLDCFECHASKPKATAALAGRTCPGDAGGSDEMKPVRRHWSAAGPERAPRLPRPGRGRRRRRAAGARRAPDGGGAGRCARHGSGRRQPEGALGPADRHHEVRQRLHRLRQRLQHRKRPVGRHRGRPTRSGSARSRLKSIRTGRTASLPVMCQHCAEPPCVDVCPTGASFKRADGIVLVDRHSCIGCRYCVMACPYQARSFVHEPLDRPEARRAARQGLRRRLHAVRAPHRQGRHTGLRRGLRSAPATTRCSSAT